MFKGKPTASLKNVAPPKDPYLLPILPYQQLLENEKYQTLLKSIRELVSLPTKEYEAFYLKAITNFAKFVQQLPETAVSYYSHVGGLLDHGLERAQMALSLCHSYLIPPQTAATELSPLHELWLYAIFTAALLMDVGKIPTRQTITIYDAEGNKIKEWIPSTGPMLNQASHYKYDFKSENLERLRKFYTPLLAKQVLTETGFATNPAEILSGFDWIASNKEVLEAWLAILNEDFSGGNYLLTVIPIIQAQTIANYFAEFNKGLAGAHAKQFTVDTDAKSNNNQAPDSAAPAKAGVASQIPGTGSIFQPTQVAGTSGPTVATAATMGYIAGSTVTHVLAAGLAYWNYLRTMAQNWAGGNFNNPKHFTDSPIQMVKEGLFIAHPKLIQDFCKDNPKHGSWQTVFDQFKQLDILPYGGNTVTYYNPNADYRKFQEGIVIDPYRLLSPAAVAKVPVNDSLKRLAETATLQVVKIEPISKPNNSPKSSS